MTPDNELKFRLYVEGWRDGADGRAQDDTNRASPDYVDGYNESSAFRRKCIERVAKQYGIDLFKLAAQDLKAMQEARKKP